MKMKNLPIIPKTGFPFSCHSLHTPPVVVIPELLKPCNTIRIRNSITEQYFVENSPRKKRSSNPLQNAKFPNKHCLVNGEQMQFVGRGLANDKRGRNAGRWDQKSRTSSIPPSLRTGK